MNKIRRFIFTTWFSVIAAFLGLAPSLVADDSNVVTVMPPPESDSHLVQPELQKGKVTISVVVAQDGNLSHFTVVQSSGLNWLDQQTIAYIKKQWQPDATMRGKTFKVSLNYKLDRPPPVIGHLSTSPPVTPAPVAAPAAVPVANTLGPERTNNSASMEEPLKPQPISVLGPDPANKPTDADQPLKPQPISVLGPNPTNKPTDADQPLKPQPISALGPDAVNGPNGLQPPADIKKMRNDKN